jgi:hypothetical protein
VFETPSQLSTDQPLLLVRLKEWELVSDSLTGRTGLGYRNGMSDRELYDSTRCWWRLNPVSLERLGVEYAVAVHRGVTRALFTIDDWIQRPDGRWCFEGVRVQEGDLFGEVVGDQGRKVTFPRGSANPIAYWPT